MRKLSVLFLLFLAPQIAIASDNMADCEAVMIEKVMEDGQPTGAIIQTFAPAAGVLATIYDDEDGFLTEIDGRKVQAILCQRSSVVPSLRDYPILATGIPFALSTNFEAADSRSVTIYFKDGKFHHVFKGEDLPEEKQAALIEALEIFNLQPHDLGSPKDASEISEDNPEDITEADEYEDIQIESDTTKVSPE